MHFLTVAKINFSSSDYYIAISIAVCSKKIEKAHGTCPTITSSFFAQTAYLSTTLPALVAYPLIKDLISIYDVTILGLLENRSTFLMKMKHSVFWLKIIFLEKNNCLALQVY